MDPLLKESLDLALEYLRVLAWPVVVIVAVVMFRSSIRALFTRMTKASGFGASAEFAAEVRSLAEESKQIREGEGVGEVGGTSATQDREPATNLGRMLIAWAKLEAAAEEVAERAKLRSQGGPISQIAIELREDGLIGAQTFHILMSLRALRNDVVHRADQAQVLDVAAEDFISTVENLESAFRAAGRAADERYRNASVP